MVVRGGPGANRPRVRPVLPEQRPHPGPVSPGESPRIAAEELVNAILVSAGAGRGAILDPAPRPHQEPDAEDRESQAAQTDRWCFSSWARSSRFEKNWSSIRVPYLRLGRTSVFASRNRP